MIRYFNSFLITSIIYSLFIGGFIYLYAEQKIVVSKKNDKKRVSLKYIELVKKEETKVVSKVEKKIIEPIPKIIEPLKKEVKKDIEVPKTVKTPKKKLKKKKLKKKKLTKKILQKKIVRKKEVKKIVEKNIIKKEVKEIKKSIEQNSIKSTLKPEVIDYNKSFIEDNLLKIKNQIQKNVSYSKRARRMGIQGVVLIEFVLSKNGSIKNIKALEGHKLLRKSTIKAINVASKFFPRVKKDITIKVPVEYKLL